MALNMDFQNESTGSFIRPIPLSRIQLIRTDESNIFYKLNIVLQPTCRFKMVRFFLIMKMLNEQGKLFWSKPEPDIFQKSIFDFDIYFLSKKKQTEIAQLLDTIVEIEKITATEILQGEFTNLITDSSLKWYILIF